MRGRNEPTAYSQAAENRLLHLKKLGHCLSVKIASYLGYFSLPYRKHPTIVIGVHAPSFEWGFAMPFHHDQLVLRDDPFHFAYGGAGKDSLKRQISFLEIFSFARVGSRDRRVPTRGPARIVRKRGKEGRRVSAFPLLEKSSYKIFRRHGKSLHWLACLPHW